MVNASPEKGCFSVFFWFVFGFVFFFFFGLVLLCFVFFFLVSSAKWSEKGCF